METDPFYAEGFFNLLGQAGGVGLAGRNFGFVAVDVQRAPAFFLETPEVEYAEQASRDGGTFVEFHEREVVELGE